MNRISKFLLLALLCFLFMQLGASLFSITMIVSTLTEAPPESLSMIRGDFPYDSSAFWDIFPSVLGSLFLITLVFNWRTTFKKWVIISLGLYMLSAVFAIFVFEPAQSNFLSSGLQEAGLLYHRYDWILFSLTLLSAIALIVPIFKQLEIRNK